MGKKRSINVGKLLVETECNNGSLSVRLKVKSAQTGRWKIFLRFELSCRDSAKILKILESLSQIAPRHGEKVELDLDFIHLKKTDRLKWTFEYDRGKDQIDPSDSRWKVKYPGCREARITYYDMRAIATLVLTSYQDCCK